MLLVVDTLQLMTDLVLWCYLLCNIPAANCIMANNETDRVALVAFKAAIVQDPFGALTSWNHSLHYCHWKGILCSRRHPDRVIQLTLRSQGLVGLLSPHIGNLSFFNSIDLQNNSFHGPIPQELGRLFRLQTIEFNNNSFRGGIPNNLSRCSKLEWLNLIDNHLTGNIPAELGTIPPFIGNLSSLFQISLSHCNLHGEIPEEIARLRGLSLVQLSENNLSGKVPFGLYNISTILFLSLTVNQLEGNIPHDIGSTLPNLKFLNCMNNLFTGTIPTSLSNASKLQEILISINYFSGTMPKDLGKLPGLTAIGVYQNRLQDDLTFISPLTNCTSLQIIDADDNLFRGSLPDSIANLSIYLSWMNLHINQTHGSIPSGIGNLLNLTQLSMVANNLAGPVPSSIGRLHNLQSLLLAQNKFTELPSSLGNLTSLITLDLGENNIYGNIPPSLGNCHSLLELHLYKNNFNGSIPPEIMSLSSISTFLTLDHNALTGSLPSEVECLKNLGYMDVSYNRLSGPIPNMLSNCFSLEWLHMQANSFEGEIPQSLSMLRGLRLLDLSRNNNLFRNSSAISIVRNNDLCGVIPLVLLKATDGFSEANLIGVGSYASVYKGILDHIQMFIVDFHGNEFKALVYEFMANGNLYNWLHQAGVGDHEQLEEPRNLKLIQKVDISIGIASALEYLHCGCESTIIHGDLKPSNVLLDDEMTAHIGDFGLAKIISTVSSDEAQGQSNSIAIRGTIGYVAPEYGMGDLASMLGDVYSFGILLLEMFTNKRPTDDLFMDHLNLHNFVKNALPDRVMEIVDPYILLEHNRRSWIKDCIVSILRIGIACSMESPTNRMEMGSVISELCKIKNTYMNEGLNQD
ncbi:unnamed protein product [Camellia sinensis]